MGKVKNVILGGAIVGATIYFGLQNDVDKHIAEALTIDAGEASSSYVNQLKEEKSLDNYFSDIKKTVGYEMSVLPDSDKVNVVLGSTSELEDSLKADLGYKTMSNVHDSIKAETINKLVNEMSPEYQNKVVKNSLAKEFAHAKETVGDESKNLYESVKEFFTNLF